MVHRRSRRGARACPTCIMHVEKHEPPQASCLPSLLISPCDSTPHAANALKILPPKAPRAGSLSAGSWLGFQRRTPDSGTSWHRAAPGPGTHGARPGDGAIVRALRETCILYPRWFRWFTSGREDTQKKHREERALRGRPKRFGIMSVELAPSWSQCMASLGVSLFSCGLATCLCKTASEKLAPGRSPGAYEKRKRATYRITVRGPACATEGTRPSSPKASGGENGRSRCDLAQGAARAPKIRGGAQRSHRGHVWTTGIIREHPPNADCPNGRSHSRVSRTKDQVWTRPEKRKK